MLDIFNNNAFSTTSLTQAINSITHAPGRIGSMGLFAAESVDTTSIAIERKGDILVLVPTTPRGAPGNTLNKEKRDLRNLMVPHAEINDAVYAEEVQNIRAFGTDRQLETVMQKVAQRFVTHSRSHGVTEEYCRIGAVKGIVVYPTGSVTANLDLFAEFGVTQIAEIDLDLDNANPAGGALRKACASITRQVTDELGGLPFTGLHSLCGNAFFDDLLAHKEVRETYAGWSEAKILRESYLGKNRSESYGIFEFGGIVWENYRGSVGGTDFIDTNKAHIFPNGVPGLFKTVWSPADYIETVNTMGERLYAKQYRMQNDKGIHLDSQMNALHYCSRPRTLIKAKRT